VIDQAFLEPSIENTLVYPCGCIDRWLTWQPMPDGIEMLGRDNCQVWSCMTCQGVMRCPHRNPDLTIEDAVKSLEDLAIENGTRGRGRRLK
jgi:hypothetical protein